MTEVVKTTWWEIAFNCPNCLEFQNVDMDEFDKNAQLVNGINVCEFYCEKCNCSFLIPKPEDCAARQG